MAGRAQSPVPRSRAGPSGRVTRVADSEKLTVWELLQRYAATQSGPFTSQAWFRRHAPSKANDRTVRTHLRGACCNVGDRSQFTHREPFLARVDRGVFRGVTDDELERWRTTHRGASGVSGQSQDVHEEVAGDDAPKPSGSENTTAADRPSERDEQSEWHTEAQVQSALITALVVEGWRVLSAANTATKEHGIDVVAGRDGQTVGVEVKGFPSRRYADPSRATETKRTTPSTQAAHWYAQAVLAAMRLRSKEPTWRSVIVLPDFPRYRDLYSQTAGSLAAAQIEVWWIDQLGALHSG